MLFLRLVNTVLCEISMFAGWTDANDAYSECLRTAQGTDGGLECYNQLVVAIGELSYEFVSCLF
jgi:hypothetical protein